MDMEMVHGMGEFLFKGLMVLAIVVVGRLWREVRSFKLELWRLKQDVNAPSD